MTDSLPPESERMIQSLHSPTCYPETVERVELIETHISWVLLTGKYAYKIKKPVDFGFVNFSTIKRRKFFCDEEIRLNGRLAESIYLGVVPISGTPEEPRVEGDGAPLEYAVKMRQFPQEALLSRAIENGNLHREHMETLAEEIADFHGRIAVASPGEESWQYGTPEKVVGAAYENLRTLLEQDLDASGSLVGEDRLHRELRSSRSRLHMLLDYTRSEAARLSERFEQRRREGAVRECHGDMHLGNMLLDGDDVLIFDGIDFNADLRWIDVQSEIAFCVMDLFDRNRRDFAYRLLNGYLERTGDYAGLDVSPFYLTYRALVRAKVAHLGWQQHGEDESEIREKLRDSRQDYLDLATSLAVPEPPPQLLITRGVSGSGKSFGTEDLIESLGAIRVRSDVERKRLAGMDRLDQSHSKVKNDLYSEGFTRQTYQHLAECAEAILRSGFTAIVDATFLKTDQREMMRSLANRLDVPFHLLDFQADEEQLRERISKRLEAGADPSEANLDVLNLQLRNCEALTPEEQANAIPVNTAEPEFASRLLEAVEETSL